VFPKGAAFVSRPRAAIARGPAFAANVATDETVTCR
jgi:hypothetical protein